MSWHSYLIELYLDRISYKPVNVEARYDYARAPDIIRQLILQAQKGEITLTQKDLYKLAINNANNWETWL
jgi:hypothetical protein